MQNKDEISVLTRHHKYRHAVELLGDILRGNTPAVRKLESLFNPVTAPYIQGLIGDFIESELPAGIILRQHTNAPGEIKETRNKLESDTTYQQIEHSLLLWQLPETLLLRKLCGEYAEAIRDVYRIFLELGLRRKCGIASTAHLNRVGALAGTLGLDKTSDRKYSAVGALHDAVEDLLNRATDKRGMKYGLTRYREFLDDHIPAPLQEALMSLTNHYDLILNHIQNDLRRKDQAVSQERLLRALEVLKERLLPDVQTYVEKMHIVLKDAELEPNINENAKWMCYRNLYIHDMAVATHAKGDYRTYEAKGLDISDNAMGRDALAMSGRIKNIVKMDIWAREGYALKSSWAPLNNHIMEMEEEALVDAENLVVRDFLEPVSSQDFVKSGLLKDQRTPLCVFCQ